MSSITTQRMTCGLSVLWAVLVAVVAPTGAAESRHPVAEQAEARFFELFNSASQPSDEALGDLMTAFFIDPEDARTHLLLGLNHLWLAAEGDRRDPRVIEHLYLAERFLARADERAPDDARLASWLLPARTALASIEQEFERAAELKSEMVAAYETDPNFHSFVVGMQSFGDRRDSDTFAFGLSAMRAASACVESTDPSCGNRPHWPHNVEAFLVFAADFETKAGEMERARELLTSVKQLPTFASWPYRGVVDERLAELSTRAELYANADEEDDPLSLFANDSGSNCQACHRAE